MRIWLGLATPDADLQRYFGEKKASVVHKDALSRGYWGRHGIRVVTNAYLPEQEACSYDLAHFISEKSEDCDFCIALVDRRWEPLVAGYRTSCFVVPFDVSSQSRNYQNFFQSLTTASLRVLGQIAAKFDKGRDAELLTLPLRNFHAEELREIAASVAGNIFIEGLGDTIESHLARLRQRVRPRRQSNHKTLYAIDDRKRFFAYGHERHAKVETGADHTSHCSICAKFLVPNFVLEEKLIRDAIIMCPRQRVIAPH